jgi:hypothetical protein
MAPPVARYNRREHGLQSPGPTNEAAIALHRSLGMTATLAHD